MALTGQAPFNRRQFNSFALSNVLDAPILPTVGAGAITESSDVVAGTGAQIGGVQVTSSLSRIGIGPKSPFSKFRQGISGISPPAKVSGSGAIVESVDVVFGSGSGPGYVVASLDPKRIGPQSPFSKFRDQRLGASFAPIQPFIIGSGAIVEGVDAVTGAAQNFVPSLSYLSSANLGPHLKAPFGLNQFKALQQGATSKPVIAGSGSIAESSDAAAGSGASAQVGSGSILETAADVVSGTGTVSGQGSGAIIDPSDTAAGTGVQSAIGSGAAADGSDTVTGAGGTGGIGLGAASDAPDVVSGVASQSTSGAAAIVEGNDSVAGIGGATSVAGSGSAIEIGDTVAGLASASTVGSGDIVENPDVVSTFATPRIVVKPEANRTFKIE